MRRNLSIRRRWLKNPVLGTNPVCPDIQHSDGSTPTVFPEKKQRLAVQRVEIRKPSSDLNVLFEIRDTFCGSKSTHIAEKMLLLKSSLGAKKTQQEEWVRLLPLKLHLVSLTCTRQQKESCWLFKECLFADVLKEFLFGCLGGHCSLHLRSSHVLLLNTQRAWFWCKQRS